MVYTRRSPLTENEFPPHIIDLDWKLAILYYANV
jgi:hypothetical protein